MSKLKRIVRSVKEIMADETRTFARTPREFSIKDWKNALIQAGGAIKSKRLTILAAGVSYFATLAVFPAIAAAVALLSLVLSDENLTDAIKGLELYLPSDIAQLIASQIEAALADPSSGVVILIVGLIIAFISLSGAATNIISASNAVYDLTETRGIVKLRLRSLMLIGMGGVLLLATIMLLILNENWLLSAGVPFWLTWTIIILRWVVIAGIVAFGLSVFYRYAPDRKNPHWQWVTWGSSIATVVWLLATTLFFVYARFFAHYTESYSVFAGIVVLMIWFNLSAFAVLLGGEINYRLENQTRAKTTK